MKLRKGLPYYVTSTATATSANWVPAGTLEWLRTFEPSATRTWTLYSQLTTE
jgi:hypothetical protein